MQKAERMRELIQTITSADEAYYKFDDPIMTDLEYDQLYDELAALEQETGIILSSSPTQRVSGEVLESLSGRCCQLISGKASRISTVSWADARQS